MLQFVAVCCIVLQCVAMCCSVLQRVAVCLRMFACHFHWLPPHCVSTAACTKKICSTLQHTASQCNTLQHTATHCNTLQHTATHCNTLQHTATHCDILQHTVTRLNPMQHTATHCNDYKTDLFFPPSAIVIAYCCNVPALPRLPPLARTCRQQGDALQHTTTRCNTF